jgi:hypothetical protein
MIACVSRAAMARACTRGVNPIDHGAIQPNGRAPHALSQVVNVCCHIRMQPPAVKEFVMHQTPDFGDRLVRGTAAATPARQEAATSDTASASHQLCFASLFDPGRALSFPCDRCGEVQLDALSERARSNYFFARAAVGRDCGMPIVIAPMCGSTR